MPGEPTQSEPGSAAAPSLGYATFDSDGTPDWHEEAERLIDAGAPPRKLRKHFRKSQLAASYWAKSMRRRYPPGHRGTQCVGCESACAFNLELTWRLDMPARHFELRATSPIVTYVTHHTICFVCLQRWHRVNARWGWLDRIAAVSFAVGVAMFLGVWFASSRLQIDGQIRAVSAMLPILLVILVPGLLRGLARWRVQRSFPGSLQQLRRPTLTVVHCNWTALEQAEVPAAPARATGG